MEELITVVVPVYNTERYLEKAVESICSQTYTKLEILLVDDGSTDKSGKKCDELAERDARIRVVHKENGGLTAAWKTGVELAKGNYIGFVDSDDYVEKEMYKTMYEAMKREKADIVCCGIHHVFEDNRHKPWEDEMLCPRESYTKKEIEEELYPIFINNGSFMGRTLQPNRVSKLIQKELVLKNLDFCDDGVTVGEDFQFSLSIFTDAEKIVILKGYLPYYYMVNQSSMTGRHDRSYLGKIKYMKRQLEKISDKKGVYDFKPQISNDFLCLTVLHIKGEILRNQKAGYFCSRKVMQEICGDSEVEEALKGCHMPGLTTAERLFLSFMARRWYFAIYVSVCIYFRERN